jgi:hypothetical protein
MRKHWYFFAILFISLLALNNCARYTIKVDLTAEQIQSRLDDRFPLFLPALDYITVLDKPEIRLLPDKVEIHLQLFTPTAEQGLPVIDVTLTGLLAYNNQNLTFYLKDLELVEFITDLLEESRKRLLTNTINLVIANSLKEIPLYTLDQSQFKEKLAAYFLSKVDVEQNKLVLTLALPKM